jgi:tRNA(adenine34) deaminase
MLEFKQRPSPARNEQPMIARPNCQHCAAKIPSRRVTLGALAGAATILIAAPLRAMVTSAPASPDDEKFMRMAIEQARLGDFPFGTVIVRDGEVIARGRNRGRELGDPTDHGEMDAIRRCIADRGSQAMRGATLYTSGEPCAMCMGAIIWCGFGRLVFAASVEQLATRIGQIMIPAADVAAKAPFMTIAITGGVLADEAMQLFAK